MDGEGWIIFLDEEEGTWQGISTLFTIFHYHTSFAVVGGRKFRHTKILNFIAIHYLPKKVLKKVIQTKMRRLNSLLRFLICLGRCQVVGSFVARN